MEIKKGTLLANVDEKKSKLPESWFFVLAKGRARSSEISVQLSQGGTANNVRKSGLLALAQNCTPEDLQAISEVPKLPEILRNFAIMFHDQQEQIEKLQDAVARLAAKSG